MRAATGATAAGAAIGAAAGQEGNESGGNRTDGNQTEGNQTDGNQTGGNETEGNQTDGGNGGGGGTEEVAVGPGGELVFDPDSLTIAPGTTVNWTWDSDTHNIVVENQPEEAQWEGTPGGEGEIYDSGYEYSFTFEVEGPYDYYCAPHRSAGMVAAVEVSADAGGDGGGGGGPPQIPDSAKSLGIASVLGMLATLGLAYFFLRFGGGNEG